MSSWFNVDLDQLQQIDDQYKQFQFVHWLSTSCSVNRHIAEGGIGWVRGNVPLNWIPPLSVFQSKWYHVFWGLKNHEMQFMLIASCSCIRKITYSCAFNNDKGNLKLFYNILLFCGAWDIYFHLYVFFIFLYDWMEFWAGFLRTAVFSNDPYLFNKQNYELILI